MIRSAVRLRNASHEVSTESPIRIAAAIRPPVIESMPPVSAGLTVSDRSSIVSRSIGPSCDISRRPEMRSSTMQAT